VRNLELQLTLRQQAASSDSVERPFITCTWLGEPKDIRVCALTIWIEDRNLVGLALVLMHSRVLCSNGGQEPTKFKAAHSSTSGARIAAQILLRYVNNSELSETLDEARRFGWPGCWTRVIHSMRVRWS